ncbi:MAG: 6-phosphogluconolactonase [Elusimicrobia bacterium]|nr:6-phosphogluconolactonase [Elusimicrobiota bacterium]
MPTSVRGYTDAGQAAAACAGLIKEALGAAERAGRPCVLGLSGASAWKSVYFLLTKDKALDWDGAEFYWADEAYVGPEHKDSAYRAARDLLLAPLGIADGAVHAVPTAAKDPDADARRYETLLRARWPGAAAPAFDVVLLGDRALSRGSAASEALVAADRPAGDAAGRWVAVNRTPPARKPGAEAHEGPRIRLQLSAAALTEARFALRFTVGEKDEPSSLEITDRV